MSVASYRLDPDDPRAPSQEQWDAMSEDERKRVVAMLPSELPRRTMPEGDPHRIPKVKATEALEEFFRRMGRRVYLSAELPVYYPDEPWFAPDLIAVLDVDPGLRDKWVVASEGKGIDFILEITLSGDRRKDLERNVARFARLGVPEYFILDLRAQRIVGYRLDRSHRTYVPVVPQAGRWASEVLGLDLVLERGRIRFFAGSAPLLEADELIARLSTMVDELVRKEEMLEQELATTERRAMTAEERAMTAEERATTAEERATTAEERATTAEERAARLAQQLRELGVDPEE